MRQVLENLKTGECLVRDVPAPMLRSGFVLVRNEYSLISSGTERGTVELGQMTLLGKARARPEQAMKVLQLAKTQGMITAYNTATRSLDVPIALGYSSAGTAIEVGENVGKFRVGDKVACGGAGFANHAEVVCVPKNLCVHVPQGVTTRHAAFTTLGAIALQSVRIAGGRLGDNVLVIGLGLLGLLVERILRAAGCKVFGVDIDPERVSVAKARFDCQTALADLGNLKEIVNSFFGGIGADAVIITAASSDNRPVALAGDLARRKGRVVVVGRTEMTAPRETYLFKELELCTSMSHGPGTGDPSYELAGVDYPIGYVRWTENRNMAAFLDLVAEGRIDLEPLISHEFDIDDAERAFSLIAGKTKQKTTAVILRYPTSESSPVAAERIILKSTKEARPVVGRSVRSVVIGAGSFATNEFLPLLAKQKNSILYGIASATGVRARALGDKYGFELCTSDARTLIEDDKTDCVFILTRHDTHAELAEAALKAGKHVFVEKPLALRHEDLDRVADAQRRTGLALMVGFNRRYAPLALKLKRFFMDRGQPIYIQYRANVGHRPPEHWLYDPEQGGGVILGEACHHIDFCSWLVGSMPNDVSVHVMGAPERSLIPGSNVHILLSYPDGSLATVAYLSNGCKGYPNERVEVYCDNKTGTITDYRLLELAQGFRIRRTRLWFGPDRGHAGQIRAIMDAVRQQRGVELDVQGYIDSSRTAIKAAILARAALHGADLKEPFPEGHR